MFVFLVAAIGEVIVGVLVYEFLDPKKARSMSRFLRWEQVLDFERKVFHSESNLGLIKRANKVALAFCTVSAIVTIINGILHVYFGVPDLKEILIIVTVLGIWPMRYVYILIKR